jgi:L-lysine 6-transaminase
VTNPKIRFPMTGENLAATVKDEEASIREVEEAFRRHGADVAAVILEPIQCEGGDNHFRPEYLRRLREICDREAAMLVFDVVQTGFYSTGRPWCFQHLGVEPDLVAFGKKAQVCGFFANARVETVERHVFAESSRINSTWGGNLGDMVRSKWIHRAIRRDRMAENASAMGEVLVARLAELGATLSDGWVAAARGRGTIVAFDCPTKEGRDALLKRCFANRFLVLACGERSIRFRPPLNVSRPEIDRAMDLLGKALADLGVKPGARVAAGEHASRLKAQAGAPGGALGNAE